MSDAPSRRIPAFDGIRGVAIIWVVLHNATAMPLASSPTVLHVLPVLVRPGWIGVQLFFALSGFLITSGLLDSQGRQHFFRNFYARRALRILPLYYTVLLVLLVLLPRVVALHLPYNNDHQIPLWLFTANWVELGPNGFGHFWSLAVEEQFYLLWPLLVFWLPPRRLLTACLAISVAALLLRIALVGMGTNSWTLYANTACRMDALALGAAGACLLHIPEQRTWLLERLPQFGAVALIVFLVGAPLTHLYDTSRLPGETIGYTLLAFASAAFVTWAALLGGSSAAGVGSVLASAPLRSFGKYSYGIYVFHNLLHKLVGEPWLIARFGKLIPLLFAFAYGLGVLAISYVIAFCSYHVLEKHFLRLKGDFTSRDLSTRSSS